MAEDADDADEAGTMGRCSESCSVECRAGAVLPWTGSREVSWGGPSRAMSMSKAISSSGRQS
jgi:hypothetical protein